MGAPYGDDLRRKALEALARGEKPGGVARLLRISRNTLHQWRRRQATTGSCSAKRGYQKGHGAKITDWDEFRRFAELHCGKTVAAMALLRGVGRTTLERGLKKIGFTRKKRPTAIANAMRGNGKRFVRTWQHSIPPN